MTVKLNDLQTVCRERADSPAFPHGLRDWSLTQWTNALAGEVGELCNFAKKVERDNVDHDEDMSKEVADIAIYAAIVAEYVEISLAREGFDNLGDFKKTVTDELRDKNLTHWTNALAARCGVLCDLSDRDCVIRFEYRQALHDILVGCAVVAEYIGVDLSEEVVKKFNEVSDKRGVDIKL